MLAIKHISNVILCIIRPFVFNNASWSLRNTIHPSPSQEGNSQEGNSLPKPPGYLVTSCVFGNLVTNTENISNVRCQLQYEMIHRPLSILRATEACDMQLKTHTACQQLQRGPDYCGINGS